MSKIIEGNFLFFVLSVDKPTSKQICMKLLKACNVWTLPGYKFLGSVQTNNSNMFDTCR